MRNGCARDERWDRSDERVKKKRMKRDAEGMNDRIDVMKGREKKSERNRKR